MSKAKERLVRIDLKMDRMEMKDVEEVYFTSSLVMVDGPDSMIVIPQNRIDKIEIIGPVKVHHSK